MALSEHQIVEDTPSEIVQYLIVNVLDYFHM